MALKNSKAVPETKFQIPEAFVPEIRKEFDRLRKIDFEEEFDPSTLFRYNVSNFENFDEVLDSNEGDDFEDYVNEDSISVGKRTKKTAKKGKKGNRKGSSIGSQEEIEELDEEENLSILSGARSEGLGRREPLQQIMKDFTSKKKKI